MAAASIANIVKSSLGPVGLDKMLVDDIGVRSNCYRLFRNNFLGFNRISVFRKKKNVDQVFSWEIEILPLQTLVKYV